jgi:hypothetical protein
MIIDKNYEGPEGLWLACDQMEAAAEIGLKGQLSQFEPAIRDCYEAGVQVPTLTSRRNGHPDILLSALFLKKALNDIRTVWILACLGYTSQAAAVAATLYENAMAASCLAGSLECAGRLQKQKSGDLPWSAQELAKLLAKRWHEEARTARRHFSKEDYELAWREVYSAYKWLCKIKHPTYKSAAHDSMAASVKAGEYVVMAAPDVRREDLPVKATILTIAISRVREAIRCFSVGVECDERGLDFNSFKARMDNVLTVTGEAYAAFSDQPLPFDISDSALSETYGRLKGRFG